MQQSNLQRRPLKTRATWSLDATFASSIQAYTPRHWSNSSKVMRDDTTAANDSCWQVLSTKLAKDAFGHKIGRISTVLTHGRHWRLIRLPKSAGSTTWLKRRSGVGGLFEISTPGILCHASDLTPCSPTSHTVFPLPSGNLARQTSHAQLLL